MFKTRVPFGFPQIVRLSRRASILWNANFNTAPGHPLYAGVDTLFSVDGWIVFANGSVMFDVSMVSRREIMAVDAEDVIGVECLGFNRWKPITELKKVLNIEAILMPIAACDMLTLTQDGVGWWNHRKEFLQNGYSDIDCNTLLNVIAAQSFNSGEFELLVCHMCTNTGEAYDVPEYFIQRN